MKNKIIRVFTTLALTIAVCAQMNATTVSAVSATLSYTDTDTNSKYGTSGKLTAKTTLNVSVPLVTGCDVKSKGTSNTTYSANGDTDIKRTFVSHTIYAKIGGIGGGSISSSSGVAITSSGSSATYSCDTYNWSYTIYSDIWRLYSYRETHSVSYKLKKTSKSAVTISLSAQIKY